MRQLFCILLLLCLPLQSIAAQWEHASVQDGLSLRHWVDHDEHVEHHHDDDGTIHYDHSDESAEHLRDHAGTTQPAAMVLAAPLVARTLPWMTLAPPEAATFLPDPIPDCPHRPPSTAPG